MFIKASPNFVYGANLVTTNLTSNIPYSDKGLISYHNKTDFI